jgi:pre-mRNA-splicing helicase BRR2
VQLRLRVQLERQRDAVPVIAPRFPGAKQEFWWLIVGDAEDNVLAIKRLTCEGRHAATLTMDVPQGGGRDFKLSFMCDSYLGCDQEYPFAVKMTEGGAQAMEQD